MSALFLTFEGLDGSGKSTHAKRAGAWLRDRGVPVCCTHEPGGTPLGEAIRDVFLDARWRAMDGTVEALLVFASRRQHLVEVIEPALAAGRHVLCDRFTDSSLAYQGAGRGLDRSWLEALDRLATGGRRPDHTLLFDLPAELARRRGQSSNRRAQGDLDRIDVEDLEFYRRVRMGYAELAAREGGRIHVIDSSRDVDATWRQVEKLLREILE